MDTLEIEDARGLGRDALVGIARWLRETYLEPPARGPQGAVHFPGREWETVAPEQEGLDSAFGQQPCSAPSDQDQSRLCRKVRSSGVGLLSATVRSVRVKLRDSAAPSSRSTPPAYE
jgi:hypothetical protein